MTYDALRRGRWSETLRIYHVTIVTKGRLPLFHDITLGRLIVSHVREQDERALTSTLAWVLMPDHLHWLFELGTTKSLSAIMQSLKGASARTINAHRHSSGAVWQRAYHDHALRTDEDVVATARYIVANPLRAGLVDEIGKYPLWDAVWL
ncbi:MAG: transposase [Azoarcus sp.]|nr:transposase [Azoarcus sp.]